MKQPDQGWWPGIPMGAGKEEQDPNGAGKHQILLVAGREVQDSVTGKCRIRSDAGREALNPFGCRQDPTRCRQGSAGSHQMWAGKCSVLLYCRHGSTGSCCMWAGRLRITPTADREAQDPTDCRQGR